MATRFYLPSTGAAEVSPAFDASWDNTAEADRFKMVTTKISSAMATVNRNNTNNQNQAHLFRQYVSAPLDSGTLSATQAFKMQMRIEEVAAGNNMFISAILRVVSNDGTTFRSPVPLANTLDDVEAAVTTLTNRQWTATSGSAVTITQDDRLVLEIGLSGDPAGGGDHQMNFRVGDASGTDLAENDTSTTDNNPWFETVDTLTLAPVFELGAAAVTLALTVGTPPATVEHVAGGSETLAVTVNAVPTLTEGDKITIVFAELYRPAVSGADKIAAASESIVITVAAVPSRELESTASELLAATVAGDATVEHPATAARSLAITVVAAASVDHSAAASESLTITVAPVHSVELGAAASVTLSMTAIPANETVEHAATAAETLAITVAAGATVDHLASASETLAISVSAQSAIDHAAAASELLAIFVTAISSPEVPAAASETISITVSALTTVEHSATAAETLALTVAADATVDHVAAAAESLVITVASDATVEHPATAAATLAITVSTNGQPVDFAIPTSDISTGTWENEIGGLTNLYLSIDEGEPGVTSDFMISTALPDTVEVALSAVGDPVASDYHVVQYSAERTLSQSLDLTVLLLQGAVTKATWVDTIPQAETLFQHVLSTAQADSLTDYGDLRLRMTVSVT